MARYRRVILAFVVAPLTCAPVFVAVSFALLFLSDGSSAFRDLFGLSVGAVLIVLPVAYAVAAMLGIPGFLLLRALDRLTGMYVVLFAGIAGLAVAALFATVTGSVEPMVFIAGASGMMAAWVWWRIAARTWSFSNRLAV